MKFITFIFFFIICLNQDVSSQSFLQAVMNPFSLHQFDPELTLTFVDIDNDGDLDIVTGSTNGDLYLFKNSGTQYHPIFSSPLVSIAPIDTYHNSSPSFGDIDSDGDADLITGSIMGTMYLFTNRGTAQVFDFDTTGGQAVLTISCNYYSTPTFVDLDADGDLDIMSGASDGNFYYTENSGTATNASYISGSTNPFSLTNVIAASFPSFCDLDGDGDLDMISASHYGFHYFENIGTPNSPSFSSAIIDPFNLSGGTGDNPVFVDLDSDGDYDVMHASQSGDFYYWENTRITKVDECSWNILKFEYTIAQEEITITSTESLDKIELSDLSGKLIFQKNNIHTETESIDISKLSKGIYLLKAASGKAINVFEFVRI